MNCKRIEPLLPAFAAGDLGDDERAAVEAHIGDCAACGESLAFYTTLEASLSARHAQRPSSRAAANRVARAVGHSGREAVRWIPRWPAFASASSILLGVALLLRPDLITKFFAAVGAFFGEEVAARFPAAGEGFFTRLAAVLDSIARAVEAMSAGNDTLILALYLGVLALVLFSGSWMVTRFVRQ